MKTKQIVSLYLAVLLAVSLTACSKSEKKDDSSVGTAESAQKSIEPDTDTQADTSADTSGTVSASGDNSFEAKYYPPDGYYLNSDNEWVEEESSGSDENKVTVSADWRDMELVLDGKKIKLRESTFKDFTDNGWTVNEGEDPLFNDLYGSYKFTDPVQTVPALWKTSFINYSFGNSAALIFPYLRVAAYSYDLDVSATWNDLPVFYFELDAENVMGNGYPCPDLIINGNVHFGDKKEKIISAIGQPDSVKEYQNNDAIAASEYRYENNKKNKIDTNVITSELTYSSGDKTAVFFVDSDIGLRSVKMYDQTDIPEDERTF